MKINGATHYLWRAVGHEGKILEVVATRPRNRRAALKFLRKITRRYGRPRSIVTDRLRTCAAKLEAIGVPHLHECRGRRINNRAENSHQRLRRRERAMRRFRNMQTLQKFASVDAAAHIHFNHERHLVRRLVYKQRRSDALADWGTFAA